MTGFLGQIANDMGIREEELRAQLQGARGQVKRHRLRKNTKGWRVVHIPPLSARLVQYWTIRNVLRNVPLSSAARAFFPGASILENARVHRNMNYFVRVDIERCFPSIKKSDFFSSLAMETNDSLAKLLSRSEGDKDLEFALFAPNGACGVGYPISPYICNVVMRDFDERLLDWLHANRSRYGNCCYTRYADDLVVSTTNKGFSREIVAGIERHLEELDRPRLRLNKAKTRFGKRNAGSAQVTGLRITQDQRITLHRPYKDHVRLLLKLYSQARLRKEDHARLMGHLSFCRSADPGFFAKLSTRYFDAVASLTKSGRHQEPLISGNGIGNIGQHGGGDD